MSEQMTPTQHAKEIAVNAWHKASTCGFEALHDYLAALPVFQQASLCQAWIQCSDQMPVHGQPIHWHNPNEYDPCDNPKWVDTVFNGNYGCDRPNFANCKWMPRFVPPSPIVEPEASFALHVLLDYYAIYGNARKALINFYAEKGQPCTPTKSKNKSTS